MKNRVVNYFVPLAGIFILIQIACVKKLAEEIPSLVTINVTDITATSATSGGLIFSTGGVSVQARGICLSTKKNPEITDLKTVEGAGKGSFTSTISGLTAGTTYYIRAYATNGVGTGYGNQFVVKTTEELLSLTTTPVSSITWTTASGGGNITPVGGTTVTARGVCWSASTGPTTANSKTSDGTGTGSFTSAITGLTPGTTYYVRAYATNSAGTSYGNEVTFTTVASNFATLTTTDIVCSSVTSTAASGGGNITSDGGATVTARGVCWSTTTNPTTANSSTSDGTGTGIFTSELTGLTAGTTYYVRAYATNSAGTSYGNEVSFTTTPTSFPNCGTVTDIDGNVYKTVTIGTQCWMAENLKTTKYRNGDPIPSVTDNTAWGALTAGAYCWYNNDATTYKAVYGALYNWYTVDDIRNVCPAGWHVPGDTEWATLTASLGGDDVAGGKLKESCFTHWASPNTGATNSTGFTALPGGYREPNGTFRYIGEDGHYGSSTAGDASESWVGRHFYYYAEYVFRSSDSKQYGFSVRCVQGEYIVLPTLPQLSTTPASDITGTSASSGGNVTSDGGATVTARGVCLSTSPGPTTTNSITSDGKGTGIFTSTITGLTAGTTYYLRAYATNSAGTAYGNEVTFTTSVTIANCGIITDIDGNIYNTVTIGTQCWIQENLKTTHFNDGTEIPIVTDNWIGQTPRYCWPNNDLNLKDVYGAFYNWYTVQMGNLCPGGWHVPSDIEWHQLALWLDPSSTLTIGPFDKESFMAGGLLKETGTYYWHSPNTNATNSTGFSALGAGYRAYNGPFEGFNDEASWWTFDTSLPNHGWVRYVSSNSASITRDIGYKEFGNNVRCVRDF